MLPASSFEGDEIMPPLSVPRKGGRGNVSVQNLQIGEKIVKINSSFLGRGGREGVCVRVVGEHSFAWVEATNLWGAKLEAFVRVSDLPKYIREVFDLPIAVTPDEAARLPPLGVPWDGLMVGTVRDQQDADILHQCHRAWQPSVTLVTLPGDMSRTAVRKLASDPLNGPRLHRRMQKWIHSELGGVTRSCWWLVEVRREGVRGQEALMKKSSYPCPLQTSLDDTVCVKGERKRTFEARSAGSGLPPLAIGQVRQKDGSPRPVYDGEGMGPDLGKMAAQDWRFWVLVKTVYQPKPVVRQVTDHELLSIWDYEGKLESKRWESRTKRWVTWERLLSPPAKIVRTALFDLCSRFLPLVTPGVPASNLVGVGRTDTVPFSRLELVGSSRTKAAQVDDAEVDLSASAVPGETQEMAKARQVLRRLAVRWWYHHQVKVAQTWLAGGVRSQEDKEAVDDAIRRMKAATYFGWPRGSRHLFYKVKDPGWRRDFCDGVAFWRLSPPPAGRLPNAKAPSRAAELLARGKVLKLRLNGYIEKGQAKLYTPRFLVPKVIEDGVVLDVRCVWDLKVNG